MDEEVLPEEVEDDGHSDTGVDDDDDDEEGALDYDWEFSPSGKVPVHASVASAPSVDQASVPGPSTAKDSGLFGVYGLVKNWTLAPELASWLQEVCDKEIPFHVLKKLNEDYVPEESLQPIFVAPGLPSAVSTLMVSAEC